MMDLDYQQIIAAALQPGGVPEIVWDYGDDRCDCVHQRIGMWKNIYTAQTMEIRLCCLFNELAKTYPAFFRVFDAYFDDNTGQYISEPQPWNGETDMPVHLWHRQLARLVDIDVPAARVLAEKLDRPLGRPRAPFFLPVGGEYVEASL